MQKNNKTYKIIITLLVLVVFVLTFILCFKSCSDNNNNNVIAPEHSVTEDFSENTVPEYNNGATESISSESSNATKKPMSGANGTQGANDKTPNFPAASGNLPSTEESGVGIANRSTAIPGYEELNLKANRKQQNIALSNPSKNNCYFKITLMLDDGTILWVSNYIKPGENSEAICLNKELEKGNYNAVLKYDCYSVDGEMKRLNGAQTKLSLRVN
mgnify:CR=1 FL=1